jgi:Flp pilus assembly pilin Flp
MSSLCRLYSVATGREPVKKGRTQAPGAGSWGVPDRRRLGQVIEAITFARAAFYRLHGIRELRAHSRQRGQGMSEYALILVLVAIAVILALTALGTRITAVFTRITNALGG